MQPNNPPADEQGPTETTLSSHDLAVPLSGGSGPGTGEEEDLRYYLLLSAGDIGRPETEQRLDRLHHLREGGRNAAVVFLLSSDSNGGTGGTGMLSYQQLQME